MLHNLVPIILKYLGTRCGVVRSIYDKIVFCVSCVCGVYSMQLVVINYGFFLNIWQSFFF